MSEKPRTAKEDALEFKKAARLPDASDEASRTARADALMHAHERLAQPTEASLPNVPGQEFSPLKGEGQPPDEVLAGSAESPLMPSEPSGGRSIEDLIQRGGALENDAGLGNTSMGALPSAGIDGSPEVPGFSLGVIEPAGAADLAQDQDILGNVLLSDEDDVTAADPPATARQDALRHSALPADPFTPFNQALPGPTRESGANAAPRAIDVDIWGLRPEEPSQDGLVASVDFEVGRSPSASRIGVSAGSEAPLFGSKQPPLDASLPAASPPGDSTPVPASPSPALRDLVERFAPAETDGANTSEIEDLGPEQPGFDPGNRPPSRNLPQTGVHAVPMPSIGQGRRAELRISLEVPPADQALLRAIDAVRKEVDPRLIELVRSETRRSEWLFASQRRACLGM